MVTKKKTKKIQISWSNIERIGTSLPSLAIGKEKKNLLPKCTDFQKKKGKKVTTFG